MHVCVVSENHAKAVMAGAEYQTQLLTEELAARPGVRLTFLARRIPKGAAAEGINYTLRQIGSEKGLRRRAVFFDAGDLRRALEELKPDVIYQQSRQSYTAVCASYAKKAGIPCFFHIAHDFDLNYRWITLRYSPNTPFDLIECLAGMRGIRNASHIIVQTERQGRMLKENFGRDATTVVRNFQPLPDSLPQKPGGPMRVFFVANFKDFKRPWLFMDLAESFKGRTDLEFIMAGRPALERRFKPMMERIPGIPNLTYLGELPIVKVNEQMELADLHVNTSTFEGFPNTFLQAWGRGAIVTTLNVDPDEGMEQMGIGFCAGGSMQRLHDFVDEMSRSPERRRQIQQNAFEFVHEHHSMKHCARLASLILDTAEARRRQVG